MFTIETCFQEFPEGDRDMGIYQKIDVDNRLIKYAHGKEIYSFIPLVLKMCYKLLDEEIELTEDWMKELPLDPIYLMKSWWILGKNFKTRSSTNYPTKMLKTPYRYVVGMLCILYGNVDA
jgi:hypothetical protein